MTRPRAATLLAPLALLFAVAPAAQPVPPGFGDDLVQSGVSYFTFVEAGAPSVEVYILGAGARNGVYRLQENVSLTEALALAGGTAQTDSTDRSVSTSFVRVLRRQGASRRVIYEATAERYLREPELHPDLQNGDVVETQVTYETVPEPFTFLDGLELAGRVASLISVFLLLYLRIDRSN